MDSNLTSLLHTEAVPMEKLHQQYGALLALVEKLIGVIPNCDSYLEIWPPAFRTYNVLVPNFLNLPLSLWGSGAPKEVIGLSMYAASRAAGCAYCSAHSAAFALRRGSRPDKIARAMDDAGSVHTKAERASIAVGRALARIPSRVTADERQDLALHYSPDQIEWIVLAVSMMGFLNKFMDAIGVELERATIDEVRTLISPSGWTPGKHAPPATENDGEGAASRPARVPGPDSLRAKLSVVPILPAALELDRRWTAGVPKRWPAVGDYLHEHLGSRFPVLSRLRHGRAIRAIAVMLRDNCDPRTSVIGLPIKAMVGLVYTTMVGDAELGVEVRALAGHHRVLPGQLDEAERFARGEDASVLSAGARTRVALMLARAASPSPAQVTSAVIEECRTGALTPAAIIEIVTWIAVLQMMHRLVTFYR